ncbi:hypothetical protein HB818_03680 [Listeria booriae]|uniref:CD3337/EF1877 family mobilome membrane protein n=1 Tax=Listeria booriae TaxID=1552123 RepID=UPI0016287D97|nr:hypothetical protein [Listeria booriae]MBC1284864.1 hypothetical protein [Listeria booriae]
MQWLKKYNVLLVALLVCGAIFVATSFVSADDGSTTVDAKSVKVGGVELLSKKWDLSHYESITYTDDSGWLDKKIVSGINIIANFFFWVTKNLADLIDTGIGYLYSLDAVTLLADKVAKIGNMLWDNVYSTFGVLFFTIAGIQIFLVYAIKRNGVDAGRKAMTLFLVVGIAFVWFTNSAWYVKAINNLSNEAQGVVMKAGVAFTEDSSDRVVKGQELDGSLAIMRNAYFRLIVEKPYLIMNYGSPDKEKILKDDLNRIDDLLKFKATDAGTEAKMDAVSEKEIKGQENASMGAGNVANKLGIAFLSMIFAVVLGIPLLLIAFMNFLLQALALGLFILLPISFILSFLPSFSNTGWKTLGKLMGVFLLKALVGVIILFVFLIVMLVDTLIPATNVGMYLLNVLAIAISIILMIMYRDKLISIMTVGRVSSVDGGATDKVTDAAKNKLEGWKDRLTHRQQGDESPEPNDSDDSATVPEGANLDSSVSPNTTTIDITIDRGRTDQEPEGSINPASGEESVNDEEERSSQNAESSHSEESEGIDTSETYEDMANTPQEIDDHVAPEKDEGEEQGGVEVDTEAIDNRHNEAEDSIDEGQSDVDFESYDEARSERALQNDADIGESPESDGGTEQEMSQEPYEYTPYEYKPYEYEPVSKDTFNRHEQENTNDVSLDSLTAEETADNRQLNDEPIVTASQPENRREDRVLDSMVDINDDDETERHL